MPVCLFLYAGFVAWPWQTRRAERPNAFMEELTEVEQDCLRRLDYVETQLHRALEKRARWSAAMTVADADIMPVGRGTQVMTAVRSMQSCHRYLAVGAGAVLLLVILVTVVMCDASVPPPEAP